MVEGRVIRGCEITVRPIGATAEAAGSSDPTSRANPTLGEIVDMLATTYPDRAWQCDPAHRDLRVGSIVIRDR